MYMGNAGSDACSSASSACITTLCNHIHAYVYTRVYVFECRYARVCIPTHAYHAELFIQVCTRAYACIHVCVYAYTDIYACLYAYVHMYVCKLCFIMFGRAERLIDATIQCSSPGVMK